MTSHNPGHVGLDMRATSSLETDAVVPDITYKGGVKMFPTEVLNFSKHREECKRIFYALRRDGWYSKLPIKHKSLKLWVEWLQWNIRFYLYIPIKSRCLTVEDYFYGNLVVGPSFTEWLKKTRHFTMQANIALDQVDIPEEYYLEDWSGYDSFLPETSLIHWEEEIDDFQWSFMPTSVEVNINSEEKIFLSLLKNYGPKELSLEGTSNVLRFVKASKFFNPISGKSNLIRDMILEMSDVHPGWVGKRVLIQALPGGGRDGSMATPSTLVKIKLSSEIFLNICEHIPYSAMCSHELQIKRISRIRDRGKAFLHWDFKKVGLTADRKFFIGLSRAIQSLYDLDMSWFDFEDLFIVDLDRSVYRPNRGYALGWMNEGITIVIIRWLLEFLDRYELKKKIDFIVFNDDVEIALLWDPTYEEMMSLKYLLLEFFKEKDIPCSIKKIFFSRESIFLEDYYAPDSKFDFEKRSIATRIYSKAAMSSLPFMRKSYVSVAAQTWYDKDIVDMIIRSSTKEFPTSFYDEMDMPFESGGWHYSFDNGLNQALLEKPIQSLYSHFLGKISITSDTKPVGDPKFKWHLSTQRDYRLMSLASNHYWNAIEREKILENFSFNLAESLELFLDQLPEGSPLKHITDLRSLSSNRIDPEGVG